MLKLLQLVAISAGVVLLASAPAAGERQPAADLAPFVVDKAVWDARMSNIGPGTETVRIEYRSRDDWRVVMTSHSVNPSAAGSSWTYASGTTTYYDATRIRTKSYAGDNVPDHFIAPGVLESLTTHANARVTRERPGVVTVRSGAPARQVRIDFNEATRLPLLVEATEDGTVVTRITYMVR